MTFYSALEDFAGRTLAALPSRFVRLLYLAGLRDARGGYSHWGLNRIHGEAEMQKAAAESHRHVFADLLQTPLQDLESDAAHASRHQGSSPEKLLSALQQQEQTLLAPDLGPESRKHFSSVLLALARLAQAKSAPTRRAS